MRVLRLLCALPAATFAVLAVSCLSLASSQVTTTQQAPVQDLGALPGFPITQGTAINQHGDVAGFLGNSIGETDHAFLYRDGGMIDLGVMPNGESSDATGVNDLDHVVGYGIVFQPLPNPPHAFHAFFWKNGVMTDLGLLPNAGSSQAHGINNQDQVVGTSGHAFLWEKTTGMQDLGTLPGGNASSANAINNRGQIVGGSSVAGGPNHPFLYENGTMRDLGTLPGAVSCTADGINDGGDIVGTCDIGAFLYTQGQMINLTAMPGFRDFRVAFTINNRGEILGENPDETRYGANLLIRGGQLYDITVTSPPYAVNFRGAPAINDSGKVPGSLTSSDVTGIHGARLDTQKLLQQEGVQ